MKKTSIVALLVFCLSFNVLTVFGVSTNATISQTRDHACDA